jgi:glucarate dehydratase
MSSKLRIENIEHFKVTIPLEAPILWSQGYRTATTRTIIKVKTDKGITGIGETRGDEGIDLLVDEIARRLKGENPYQLESISEKFHMMSYFQGYFGLAAIAGVEIALWDIIAKKADRPLCDLIGGRYRDPIPFSGYIFYRAKSSDGKGGEATPEQIVKFCEKAVDKFGFSCLKLKGGAYAPEHDIAVLRAIRNRFGDKFKLRIDPNGCWSVQTAIWVCKELEKIGLEYLEDPVWGIEGMSRLRKDICMPIATNMCVVNFDTLPTGIRENAVDIILADAHKWGGILTVKKLAAVCNAFKIGMSIHSGAELGVSTAVNLHLAASTPEISYSIDGHYHHILDDIIKGGKHQYDNGCIKVPEGPGLGVELDEEKVAYYNNVSKTAGVVSVTGESPIAGKKMSRSQY